jgi:hypothetical protein
VPKLNSTDFGHRREQKTSDILQINTVWRSNSVSNIEEGLFDQSNGSMSLYISQKLMGSQN